MRFYRLKVWLSRIIKRLDEHFTREFWKEWHKDNQRIIDSIEIRAKDIKFETHEEKN